MQNQNSPGNTNPMSEEEKQEYQKFYVEDPFCQECVLLSLLITTKLSQDDRHKMETIGKELKKVKGYEIFDRIINELYHPDQEKHLTRMALMMELFEIISSERLKYHMADKQRQLKTVTRN
jgi:hypothetical protein